MIDLERLKALEANATKGPWLKENSGLADGHYIKTQNIQAPDGSWAKGIADMVPRREEFLPGRIVRSPVPFEAIHRDQIVANGSLICELRNSLPQIISLLEAAEGMAESLHDIEELWPSPGEYVRENYLKALSAWEKAKAVE